MYILKININDITNNQINETFSIIKKQKYNKIKKLKKIISIKQAIGGEMLLIEGLKKFYNLDYKNIDIFTNSNGKPFLKDENIFFNISHCHDLVVCGFSNYKIGIDIEQIRKTNLNTSNIFATELEKKYIFKEKENQEKRLFEIYTLKEAYIKMLGSSINNIKNVEFNINDKIICSNKNVNAYLMYEKDYIIAIAEMQ